MEYWEFLLQKEGDRSWLPLESPDVEILEGRYRVMARSSRKNTPVEIRICHQTVEEIPPRRRVQKRTQQTNGDGLMVVIPFTALRPGIWELSCAGDLMSDMLGQGWRYTVRLRTLPQEMELGGDWEGDWEETMVPPEEARAALDTNGYQPFPTAAPDLQEHGPQSVEAAPIDPAPEPSSPASSSPTPEPDAEATGSEPLQSLTPVAGVADPDPSASPIPAEVSQLLSASMTEWLDVAEQMSHQLMQEVFGDLEASPTPGPTVASPEAATEPLTVTLAQESYVACWGDSLPLVGQVDLAAADTPQADRQPVASDLGLQVLLRDPQTSQVLLEFSQPLPAQVPPIAFVCPLNLPASLQTRLVLGEIVLFQGAERAALDSQAFTIMADVADLLGAITEEGMAEEEEAQLPLEPLPEPESEPSGEELLKLSFLDLDPPSSAPTAKPSRLEFLAGQPLPPQLYRPDPAQPRQTLDLPSFQIAAPEEPAPAASEAIEATEATEVPAAIAAEAATPTTPEPSTLDLPPAPTPAEPLPEATPIAEAAPAVPESVPIEEPPALPQDDFRSLRLQERFWARLNALAIENEPPAPGSTAPPANANPEPGGAIVPNPEADWMAQEFVVEDDPLPVAPPRRATVPTSTPNPLHQANPLVLSADEAIPVPELELSTGELVSGQAITIWVKLPNLLPRIYVKLWINDRQTRTLLDGPRWLLDFVPDGLGNLEATTQLMVPFGSLEIQIEAIAVEMATQRESHKVSLDRAVVPPDLPNLSLDEFGI